MTHVHLRKAVIATAAALAVVLAGCGSSSSGAGGSSATAADPEAVSQAKALMTRALQGPVYSKTDLATAKASDFVSMTSWMGPTEAPAPKSGLNLQIIVCLVGTACETGGKAAAEAATALGWSPHIIDGKGTPQGAAQAFQTAMAQNPDAILVVSIDQSVVADQLAEAHQRKIPVVAIAVKNTAAGGYDATVTRQEIMVSMMEAWYAVADSDGKAQVVFVWDQGYPHLVEGLERARSIVEQCSGCKVLEVYNRTLATATNAASMQQLTTSILQKYSGAKPLYILTPYGFGVAPMVAAVAASGRTDVKIVSKNAQDENLQLVAKGEQAADFGSSIAWWGYAGVDQLVRLLGGQRPLDDAAEGLGVRAYDKSNAAGGNVSNWTTPVDFKSEYLKIWGVG